jgi:adenosylhomocysteine nucleosidase/adenosylhomocysteine/aminodeoxyfutalosine nucleosidase
MIGIVVTNKQEWNILLQTYNISKDYLEKYPYGEYYTTSFQKKEIVFFRCLERKINTSGATQYMIDKFNLKKIILLGTCSSVKDYDYGDIIIPTKTVEYDLMIRELEPLINKKIIIDLEKVNISQKYIKGLIGTSDKALVLWRDYLKLKEETNIIASDLDSASIAKVCKINNVDIIIIKGITDKPMNGENGLDEQVEVYEENLPIVFKNILENYLPEVLL